MVQITPDLLFGGVRTPHSGGLGEVPGEGLVTKPESVNTGMFKRDNVNHPVPEDNERVKD